MDLIQRLGQSDTVFLSSLAIEANAAVGPSGVLSKADPSPKGNAARELQELHESREVTGSGARRGVREGGSARSAP